MGGSTLQDGLTKIYNVLKYRMECTVFNLNVIYNPEQYKQLQTHIWKSVQSPQSIKIASLYWCCFVVCVCACARMYEILF